MSVAVPGYSSIRALLDAVVREFERDAVRVTGGELTDQQDALGFELVAIPRYLFSVSTHAGALADGVYDFDVHICDDTVENGEIAFMSDANLDISGVVAVVSDFASGNRAW